MKNLATLCSATIIVMILVAGTYAQEISRDEYLTYVPLDRSATSRATSLSRATSSFSV